MDPLKLCVVVLVLEINYFILYVCFYLFSVTASNLYHSTEDTLAITGGNINNLICSKSTVT